MENVVTNVLMVATGKDKSKVQELKVNRYKLRLENFRCYKKLVAAFSEKCFKLSDVSSQKLNLLMFSNNVLLLPIFVLINRIICEYAGCKWVDAVLISKNISVLLK